MSVTAQVIAAVASYLIGSVPAGFLLVKARRGLDVRTVGSGNIGATNVGRVLGRRWFFVCFILDLLKGFVPCYVAGRLAGHVWGGPAPLIVVLCGLLAVAGHNWPVFLRFRGGKGVATSGGVCAYLFPSALLVGLVLWGIAAALWRYVSLASIVAAIGTPACVWIQYWDRLSEARYSVGFATLAAAMVILRHRANIRRLLAGTEHKIGRGVAAPPPAEEQAAEPGAESKP